MRGCRPDRGRVGTANDAIDCPGACGEASLSGIHRGQLTRMRRRAILSYPLVTMTQADVRAISTRRYAT